MNEQNTKNMGQRNEAPAADAPRNTHRALQQYTHRNLEQYTNEYVRSGSL